MQKKPFRKVIQSSKVTWVFWSVFSIQMYSEPAEIICMSSIFSDLTIMRGNISPLPLAWLTASQSNCSIQIKNRLWPPKLGSRSTLLHSNGRIGLPDWSDSFFTNSYLRVVNVLQNKKKELSLSYTLLQWRGPFYQRGCSMAFSPIFQKQNGYWVLKDLVSVPVWILQTQLPNDILSGTI